MSSRQTRSIAFLSDGIHELGVLSIASPSHGSFTNRIEISGQAPEDLRTQRVELNDAYDRSNIMVQVY
ncbi:hypothetical protein PC111_g21183 [Phytophthora cactorum]|uniref:Uncharacterized protein n=1 Tax=Phytophthora cactorum TaxID=29920 RepID=A0A8T1B501_9STRA|nr:hypothetical protein PC111_g21183 [Phytophthora cactorum]KAG2797795.1 hypothetical protein PC112_g21631 [Phytophthora cactorum]KAG2893219.1 hypothetical protein PC117_g23831 [Phytophthora cactorum]KAG3055453.1 hypothetical protein PC122_g21711 [Phytophthora cactorum]